MSDKPALILLHGALGSKDQFSPLSDLLKDDFRLFNLNFEGHGGEAIKGDFSIQSFSSDLGNFIWENKLSPANIFGYSMGGYVALRLALTEPDKVARIMTLGTKFHWTAETAHKEASQLNPLKIEAKVPEFAETLQRRHAPTDWRELLSKTSAMMLELGKSEAIALNRFEEISCPVLVTVGGRDKMVSRGESEAVCERLPKGQLQVFESFAHPIEQVDTSQLAGRIREFFKD